MPTTTYFHPSSGQTKAHVVLSIGELVSLIARPLHRSDLTAFGLVSKKIYPQVMRILWGFLPSPLPLLKLFNGLYFLDFSQRWVGLLRFMFDYPD